jgi:hypothetical protein
VPTVLLIHPVVPRQYLYTGFKRFFLSLFALLLVQVYVVGEQGILDELHAVGIEAFGGPEDNDKRVDFSQPKDMVHDPEVMRGTGIRYFAGL